MPEEIDVLEYVRWLLTLESMEKIPTVSDAEAVRVARLLFALAPLSEEPDTIQSLAYEICTLPLRVGHGQVAAVDECCNLLADFENHLGRRRCNAAVQFLHSLSLDEVNNKQVGTLAGGKHVEYRDVQGTALYIPTQPHQYEELTLRLWDAHSALQESGCPKPYAVICDVLNRPGQDWSPQRVESRLRPFKNPDEPTRKMPTWNTSLYRFRFWGWKTGRWDDQEQPFVFQWRGP